MFDHFPAHFPYSHRADLFTILITCVLYVLCALTCLFSLLYSQMYVLHERKLKGGRVLGGDESGRPGECMYMYFVYIVCYVLAVCCVCFVH